MVNMGCVNSVSITRPYVDAIVYKACKKNSMVQVDVDTYANVPNVVLVHYISRHNLAKAPDLDSIRNALLQKTLAKILQQSKHLTRYSTIYTQVPKNMVATYMVAGFKAVNYHYAQVDMQATFESILQS